MDYIIRSFDKVNGSIVVEYATMFINIDLPIQNGLYPVGEELQTYIDNFLPKEFIERKNIIAKGIANEAAIDALVVPLPKPEIEYLIPSDTAQSQPTTQGTQTI